MSAPEPTPGMVDTKFIAKIAFDNLTDGGKFANFMFERDGMALCQVGGFVFGLPNKAKAEDICPQVCAAVQRERQAAAVKALWDAADALDAVLGEAAKFDPASHWLRGRAEAMQYIASRAERAEKGTT